MSLSIWTCFYWFWTIFGPLSNMYCPLLAIKMVQLDKPNGGSDGPFDSSTCNEHLIGDENGCDIIFS